MAQFEAGGTGWANFGAASGLRRPAVDGIADHPDAMPGCPICHSGGLLDDAQTAPAAMLVPCLCTGRCPPDAAARVRASYPNECRRLAEMAGGPQPALEERP